MLAGADPVATELARTPAEEELAEDPNWWLAIVFGVVLLGGLGYLAWQWLRSRRARQAEDAAARRPHVTVGGAPPVPVSAVDAAPAGTADTPSGADAPTFWTPSRPVAQPAFVEEPSPEPMPDIAPEPSRPRISISLHPRRAGLNLVSATADVELTVRNDGDAIATEVTAAIHLLAGRAGQDDELGALFGGDQPRPAVPVFTLAPGEERVCRTTAILPRAGIEPIVVGTRPMFVPVIAADVRYTRPDGTRGQAAAAFVVGAVRAGGAKLSPFWLDAAPRMRDEVEARAHGPAIDS